MEKNNLINNRSQPNLPITAPKYKNLFCNTSKNVGSYTHVLTVSLSLGLNVTFSYTVFTSVTLICSFARLFQGHL